MPNKSKVYTHQCKHCGNDYRKVGKVDILGRPTGDTQGECPDCKEILEKYNRLIPYQGDPKISELMGKRLDQFKERENLKHKNGLEPT